MSVQSFVQTELTKETGLSERLRVSEELQMGFERELQELSRSCEERQAAFERELQEVRPNGEKLRSLQRTHNDVLDQIKNGHIEALDRYQELSETVERRMIGLIDSLGKGATSRSLRGTARGDPELARDRDTARSKSSEQIVMPPELTRRETCRSRSPERLLLAAGGGGSSASAAVAGVRSLSSERLLVPAPGLLYSPTPPACIAPTHSVSTPKWPTVSVQEGVKSNGRLPEQPQNQQPEPPPSLQPQQLVNSQPQQQPQQWQPGVVRNIVTPVDHLVGSQVRRSFSPIAVSRSSFGPGLQFLQQPRACSPSAVTARPTAQRR